ncbi:MAG: hypothetical protein AMXMBFR34_47480 [Myxococcaceae bacterium]
MSCHARKSAPEVLAHSPCAQVSRCADGHLHVSVGPVTVRMEPGVFRALALTLTSAAARLDAEPAEHHH